MARMRDLSLKQIKPFFQRNPHLHSLIIDGDKTHPGMGRNSSLEINKLWREDPVLSRIKLITGPDEWDKDGVAYTAAAQAHRLSLARNKVPQALRVKTWAANSPDINPAEHIVAHVKLPENWAEGSYSHEDLKKLVVSQYRAYPQASIDRSIKSMRRRLQAVIAKQGYMLERSDYTVD